MDERTCIWPDCSQSERLRRDLCRKHYLRAWRLGDFEEPWESWKSRTRPECSDPDCSLPHAARGWCKKHYSLNVTREGLPRRTKREPSPCLWPRCQKPSDWRGYCQNHYSKASKVADFDTPWISWRKTCFTCGAIYEPIRHRDVPSEQSYCSSPCRAKAKRILHPERERERRRNRQYRSRALARAGDEVSRVALRERDGDSCYLCGEPIDFDLRWPHALSPSLDHKQPLSRGGEHSLLNTAMTHLTCNVRKGARVIEQKEVP